MTIVEIKYKQSVSGKLALGIVPEKWALRDNCGEQWNTGTLDSVLQENNSRVS